MIPRYAHKTSRYASAFVWLGPFEFRLYRISGGSTRVHIDFKFWVNLRRTLYVEMVPGRITARVWKGLMPKDWP